jgi:hypothetical protein
MRAERINPPAPTRPPGGALQQKRRSMATNPHFVQPELASGSKSGSGASVSRILVRFVHGAISRDDASQPCAEKQVLASSPRRRGKRGGVDDSLSFFPACRGSHRDSSPASSARRKTTYADR